MSQLQLSIIQSFSKKKSAYGFRKTFTLCWGISAPKISVKYFFSVEWMERAGLISQTGRCAPTFSDTSTCTRLLDFLRMRMTALSRRRLWGRRAGRMAGCHGSGLDLKEKYYHRTLIQQALKIKQSQINTSFQLKLGHKITLRLVRTSCYSRVSFIKGLNIYEFKVLKLNLPRSGQVVQLPPFNVRQDVVGSQRHLWDVLDPLGLQWFRVRVGGCLESASDNTAGHDEPEPTATRWFN